MINSPLDNYAREASSPRQVPQPITTTRQDGALQVGPIPSAGSYES
jgi:hypothetical protein